VQKGVSTEKKSMSPKVEPASGHDDRI
jgi:hypothetical protein